jgi:hypothetical protein
MTQDSVASPDSAPATQEPDSVTDFPVKLLRLLAQSKASPDQIASLGVCWCPDGQHFLAHARFIAISLGVSADRVRADFRAYDFPVLGQHSHWDYHQLQGLPDPANWRKRCHSSGTFCVNTTPAEAGNIQRVVLYSSGPGPMPSPNRQSVPPLAVQHPRPFQHLLAPDSPDEAKARRILDGAEADEGWKRQFLDTAKRDWICRFGTSNQGMPVDDFARLALFEGPPLFRAEIQANLAALLSLRPDSDNPGVVSFTAYLALMLRFGPMDRLRKSIEGLTVSEPSGGRGPFDGFVRWFRPTMSAEEANAAVKNGVVGTWLIRLSSIANEFTLHWQATDCFPPLVCRIRYDGLAADEKMVYATVPDNEGPQFARSWHELIVSRLGLRLEDGFGSPH